ncbi:MAG: DUF1028 domain-containing protein [Actinobacteria bacterium]|nr:MAG: DUF1028 domain-containing protein [Actinomycetota bacterium]
MTYSIVARDPGTGQLGVAVQSCFFAAGLITPYLEPGVGAVVSQAFADPSYGVLGLDLMRSGCSARETLDALLVIDADRDLRQVAVVDAEGEVAAHTGRACVAEAGHVEGLGFSVQANMMLNDTVPAAMKEAYVRGDGDFAERLVQAMEGAQREGGDFRGVQSAGLVVVSGDRHARPWEGRVFHIRVDDHAEPLAELRRLLDLARGYGAMERAMERLRVLDLEGAEGQVAEAIARLPRVIEPTLMRVALLVLAQRLAEARSCVRSFGGDRALLELALRRHAATGTFPADQALLAELLAP